MSITGSDTLKHQVCQLKANINVCFCLLHQMYAWVTHTACTPTVHFIRNTCSPAHFFSYLISQSGGSMSGAYSVYKLMGSVYRILFPPHSFHVFPYLFTRLLHRFPGAPSVLDLLDLNKRNWKSQDIQKYVIFHSS